MKHILALLALLSLLLAACSTASPPQELSSLSGSYLVKGRDMGAFAQNIKITQAGTAFSSATVKVNEIVIPSIGSGDYRGNLAHPVAPHNGIMLSVKTPDGEITARDWVPEAPIVTAPLANITINTANTLLVKWKLAGLNPDRYVILASWTIGGGAGTGWWSPDLLPSTTCDATECQYTIPAKTLPANKAIRIRVYAYNDGTETFVGPFAVGSRMAIRNGDEVGRIIYTRPCAPTNFSPAPNSMFVPRDAYIKAIYCDLMNLPTANTFVIQALQTGKRVTSAGTFNNGTFGVDDRTIYYQPGSTAPFKPGEEVEVTLTNRLRTTSGGITAPKTYRFRIATAPSSSTTFSYSPSIPVTDRGIAAEIVSGDVNRDGKLDVVVATTPAAGTSHEGTVSVFLGNGAGRFAAPRHTVVGGTPKYLTLGDFNGDGRLDIAVASTGPSSDQLKVLLSTSTGIFTVVSNTISNARGLKAADFNSDGFLDIAYARPSTNQVEILKGNGTGHLTTMATLAVGIKPLDLSIGDFNNDQRMDIAVTNEGDRHDSPSVINRNGSVSILLNGSTGFAPAINHPMSFNPFFSTAADFNNDGKLDLAVVNFAYGAGEVRVLLGNGSGSFTSLVLDASLVGSQPYNLTSGDYDGDGKLDLALVTQASSTIRVLYGDGFGNFGRMTDNLSTVTYLSGINSGDFNSDGRLDIVSVATSSTSTNSKVVTLIKNP